MRQPGLAHETIELMPLFKPVRSRSDKAIGDTLEEKWTIVAKRVIAEPTPRTPYDAPRLGIYDYEVVPLGSSDPAPIVEGTRSEPPIVAFRRMAK
jgi:hypothetical protein